MTIIGLGSVLDRLLSALWTRGFRAQWDLSAGRFSQLQKCAGITRFSRPLLSPSRTCCLLFPYRKLPSRMLTSACLSLIVSTSTMSALWTGEESVFGSWVGRWGVQIGKEGGEGSRSHTSLCPGAWRGQGQRQEGADRRHTCCPADRGRDVVTALTSES